MLSNEQVLLTIVTEGNTSISNILLANYHKIGLTDQEMMLIIHLLYFQSKGNLFPSITELETRMTLSTEEIMRILQRLVKNGFLFIESKETEKISEVYNLTPLYVKIIKALEREVENNVVEQFTEKEKKNTKNIFKIFEQEFARPLSPMEIEMINTWIDNDQYPHETIIFALKEAVYANKLNFRYIDKILFEWQKKNLRTMDEIKEHVKNFRQHALAGKNNDEAKIDFEFYNWLEED